MKYLTILALMSGAAFAQPNALRVKQLNPAGTAEISVVVPATISEIKF